MKKLSFLSLMLTLVLASCSKKNDVAAPTLPPAEPAPTSLFKISNPVSQGKILEGNILDFSNQSVNGNSYHWNFGNGITSDEKIPSGISFVPCGGTYVIALTVKNKAGVAATYSEEYTVMCRGKMAHNSGKGVSLVHLTTAQIQQLHIH